MKKIFLGLQCFSVAALACQSFALKTEKNLTVGRAFEWVSEKGFITVNKRHVEKTAAVLNPQEKPAHWVSRFGSITVNQHGREFPVEGMNERGLVINGLLGGKPISHHSPDTPVVNELQWIQYNLDNFATVKDVLASLGQITISTAFDGIYYWICDAQKECAVVQIDKSGLFSYSGSELEILALTNVDYLEGLKQLKRYADFGGKLGASPFSPAFVRGAVRMKRYLVSDDQPFAYVQRSIQGPSWNTSYDTGNRLITFATFWVPSWKHVFLRRFDFRCSRPVLVLGTTEHRHGDMSYSFHRYSHSENEALVKESLGQLGFSPEVQKLAADYPATTICRE